MDRRSFLSGFAKAAVAATAAPSLTLAVPSVAKAAPGGNSKAAKRRKDAFRKRQEAAVAQRTRALLSHPTNGDEALYASRIGNYSKGMPHNALGEVDTAAYDAYLAALDSGDPADFEAIPMGGTAKQVNPQAAYAFQMDGSDSHQLSIVAPPAFASVEAAGEMVEVYWQALLRDLPFSQYATDADAATAAAELAGFPNFAGMTAANLFRANTPGERVGPYLSQLLYKPVPYGAMTLTQQYVTGAAGNDHMTSYAEWLAIQNGAAPTGVNNIDPVLRYMRNGRDLAEYVHRDFPYQAFLNAALILLGYGGAAMDENRPYAASVTQAPFATFGGPFVLDLVAHVARYALMAAWYQKWLVHRKLRPEVYAGRIHNHLTGAAAYPLDASVLGSTAAARVFAAHGTYLLPMAYPEGSPLHTSYPAGHATIAGACVTVLKAFFRESFVIPSPVAPSDDGLSLNPIADVLTVEGELNKLASNISIGRDIAGVHYLSDGVEGMNLGEDLAIHILSELRSTYNETFAGFNLTKFDGTTIVI